jgi:hypothetical protein
LALNGKKRLPPLRTGQDRKYGGAFAAQLTQSIIMIEDRYIMAEVKGAA